VNIAESAAIRKQVTIYTDGGCEPNPGAGGYGVVLIYGTFRKEISGGFRLTTNNRMEIYAAIKGLELLKEPCDVTLFSDSKYLVDAIEKKWVLRWKSRGWRLSSKERALNIDLWEQLLPMLKKHNVTFSWVKGHAGSPNNERCDHLSMSALRRKDLPADDGYENKPPEPQPVPMTKEGQPCRKCGTPVIKRMNRHHKPFLFCNKCGAGYDLKPDENDKNLLKLF
jgi:ribonuclease HI